MKWVILLTCCIQHNNNSNDDKEVKDRTELYLQQLNNWLSKTKFMIYIVESSNNGHVFNNLKEKYPDRLNIVTFNQKELYPGWGSSSLLEAASLKHAMDEIIKNTDSCTHIFKVTGRYFLEGIEEKLYNINVSDDTIFLQKHVNHKIKWQNSEYYGMKKEFMCDFIKFVFGSIQYMEHNLYTFVQKKHTIVFGPFKNNIARGGDKLVIKNL